MKRSAFRFFIIFSLFAAAILPGCNGDRDSHTLMVSIEPQRFLLERIAGPEWNVRSLLDKSSDPENFDPTLSALKAASNSRAYFSIGRMAFEDELLPKLLEGNPDMQIFNTSSGIELLHGHGHSDADHHIHHHEADDIDPHVWCSVRNARTMAVNMRDAMVSLDPENRAVYTANCDRLLQSLDSLDRQIASRLDPARGSSFLVWHPSLSYFARDYGLQQLTIGSENKEVSAAAFRDRIDHAREAATEIFFIDAAIDRQRAEDIASQISAECQVLNLTSTDWLSALDAASRAISSSHPATPPRQ